METGNAIKELRISENMTREALAKLAGVDENTIWRVEEGGLFFASEKIISDIAEILHVERSAIVPSSVPAVSYEEAVESVGKQMTPAVRALFERELQIADSYIRAGYREDLVYRVLLDANEELARRITASLSVASKYENSPLDNFDVLSEVHQ